MNSPVRILQVLTIMNRGGAETMIMNYYRHVDRSKVQFDFLVHREERGAYDDEIETMGGRIYRIPPIYHHFAHKKAVKSFFLAHPQYQIVHGHIGELGYYIYKKAKERKIPVIIAHAHNSSCDRNWKWPIRSILKHLIRPHFTYAMTCGIEAAKWLFGTKLASKAFMLNNSIDVQLYTFNERTRKSVRKEMGWSSRFVIGDVARFSHQKNHIGLLSIFKAVVEKRPDSLLVLIGDKIELYESIKNQALEMGVIDNIQFLGVRTDVPKLMQGMDVYCSPSLFEGLSVSMIEAQASGLKVVTSNRVPEQVALIPELLSFIPLEAPPQTWVNEILAPYSRHDTSNKIKQTGFDIETNAAWLQDFYLSRL